MQERQKTLIILSPGFPKDEDDTTCLPTQQLFVKALKAAYPELKIVVLAFQYPFIEKRYNWNGVEIISFNDSRKGWLNHMKLWVKIWRVLRMLNKQYDITGLLSFWCTEYAMVAKRFAAMHGLTHFIWLLGQDARAGNPFVKFMRLKPDNLIAISDFIAEEFVHNYGVRPAYVVPNAIDESLFSDEPAIRDIDILGVGSLIPLKRYDLLIEIIAALKPRYPEIKAVICGKGIEEGKLRKQIAGAGLNENVRLTGELPHKEAIKLMERAKILLHPSSYEGFSTVCLEAIRARARVISFCQPMKENIKNWYAVKSEEAMLQQTEMLLANEIQNDKRAQTYTMNEIAHRVMELYATP
ncbi:MAG: glycosyltransferase [Flavipsychrobacter sp.]